MNSTLRYVILALALTIPTLNLAGQHILLRAGTLIRCTLDEPNFSSRTAELGDPLICYARPVREFGRSVFPRGSYLAGHLTDYRNPGRLVGKGWLKLEFDRVILSPQTEVPIFAKVVAVRGYKVDREGRILGKGHPKRDALGWMLPPLWPIKRITLPMRGPRPKLKGETAVTLRLLDDIPIPYCPNTVSPDSQTWREQYQHDPTLRRRRKRPLTDRIPLLYDLKQLANPFIGPRDKRRPKNYRNRPVERAYGAPRHSRQE